MAEKSPLKNRDANIRELINLLDVVWGAAIAYTFVVLVNLVGPWISQLRGTQPVATSPSALGVRALLVLFVMNYQIADFIEARVMNVATPYIGRGRFSLDLIIVMVFIFAVHEAARGSDVTLVALAIIFAASVIWALFLWAESAKRSPYPGIVISTHVVACVLLVAAAVSLPVNLGWPSIMRLWIGYLIWLAFVLTLKQLFEVEECDFDLLPISLLGVGIRGVLRWIKRQKPAPEPHTAATPTPEGHTGEPPPP